MKTNTILIGSMAVVAANTFVMVNLTSSSHQVQESNNEIRTEIKKLDLKVQELEKVVLYKSQAIQLSKADEDCLARNVFYEAGVEGYEGKIAVAQVTLNRLKRGHWGKNVCAVVYAHAQFSWTLDKKKKWAKPKGELWAASRAAVRDFVGGVRVKKLEGSHFYHTDYIQPPRWAKTKYQVQKIGQHIFYRDTSPT